MADSVVQKRFYQDQIRHNLHHSGDQKQIIVVVNCNLHSKWTDYIKKAIRDVSEAAPGLSLNLQATHSSESTSTIIIEGTSTPNQNCTIGNVLNDKETVIKLSCLPDSVGERRRTCLFHLLQAVGFEHTSQSTVAKYRAEGTSSEAQCGDKLKDNQNFPPDTVELVPCDPFSIMLCPDEILELHGSSPIWQLKTNTKPNTELSELDKVMLNLLYPPCCSPSYNPRKSYVTGMWYCGRPVMQNHNHPANSTTDSRCGPTNWANCPACRTLDNDVVTKFIQEDRWQGWSGLVYCGRYFGKSEPGHDGYCGPNNGPPCLECMQFLLPNLHYSLSSYCIAI